MTEGKTDQLRLIDTHAHLDFAAYNEDRAEVIAALASSGIGVINIATDEASNVAINELTLTHPHIWGTVGLHPIDVTTVTLTKLPELINGWTTLLASNPKLVGIGEIGLDYYHNNSPETAKLQQAALRQILSWANEQSKPVSFHCRNAYGDLLTILGDYPGTGGVVHCFSGNLEEAQAFIDLGQLISFTNMLTYPKNEALRQVAKSLPLTKLLIETDSPFLPPQELRGKRNDPHQVVEVAKVLAQLKDVTLEKVMQQTTENAVALFGLTATNFNE